MKEKLAIISGGEALAFLRSTPNQLRNKVIEHGETCQVAGEHSNRLGPQRWLRSPLTGGGYLGHPDFLIHLVNQTTSLVDPVDE